MGASAPVSAKGVPFSILSFSVREITPCKAAAVPPQIYRAGARAPKGCVNGGLHRSLWCEPGVCQTSSRHHRLGKRQKKTSWLQLAGTGIPHCMGRLSCSGTGFALVTVKASAVVGAMGIIKLSQIARPSQITRPSQEGLRRWWRVGRSDNSSATGASTHEIQRGISSGNDAHLLEPRSTGWASCVWASARPDRSRPGR